MDHIIQLGNLDLYSIRGIVKDWVCSYLDNRKQYVSLNESNSSIKSITTGVPQESVLEPFALLNLYQ